VGPSFGAHDQSFPSLLFSLIIAWLPLWREVGPVVCSANHSQVRVAQDPKPYHNFSSETPPAWMARFPYLYSPREPVIPQRIAFHFHRLLRLEGLRRKYSSPPSRPLWSFQGSSQVSRTTPWQETHLAQANFRKTETTRTHPHQNVLVTREQVKTLYKQQTSLIQSNTQANLDLRNTTLGYGFHIQHRNFGTFQSKTLDASRYVPNTVIRRDLQIPTVKEEIQRYSSQYSARLSAHPNDLMANLMKPQDKRRLRRHLPNDRPTRFLVLSSYL
jgi:hypothetical protein